MKTILVLEDEASVMRLLRFMLKEYNVIEATTAKAALRLFDDPDNQVDLLVADLTLPNMSGIQVALFFRSKLPGMPVILTSGYPLSDWSHRDATDLQTLGSNSVVLLQKPFQTQALLTAVGELLGASLSRMAGTA
jgi:CheY-like chemotaxis protein